jgi:hypothetical protein
MSPQKAFHRLHDMVAQDLAFLAPNTIIPDGKGYLAFEVYSIQPKGRLWQVSKCHIPVAVMTTAKVAISWCVADKYNQLHLSTDILNLDQHKQYLENDLHTRETLSRSRRLFLSLDAVEAKISSRKRRLEQVDERLTKCVNVAKYWQLRGFNNETARAGRTASHRTYR